MVAQGEELAKGMLEGFIDSLNDKHSQLDVRLDRLRLSLAGSPFEVELNGLVTVSIHLRELTAQEKEAIVERSVALHSAHA